MRIKKANIKWFVFYYVNKELRRLNIWSPRDTLKLAKEIKKGKITSRKELREYIRKELMYQYWSRVEYEMIVNSMGVTGEAKKIDVWWQIEPNLDIFVDYVIKEMKINF